MDNLKDPLQWRWEYGVVSEKGVPWVLKVKMEGGNPLAARMGAVGRSCD